MAENLNYAYNELTSSRDSTSFCYENDDDNCDEYGRLYLWPAAVDFAAVFSAEGAGCDDDSKICLASGIVRGVCPEGWHLPDVSEWKTLFENVGGEDVAGIKLKSTSGWYDDGNGTDDFGFAVLPAGDRDYENGIFWGLGGKIGFWSSSENGGNFANGWVFRYNYENVVRESYTYKYEGLFVRCLRD